MGLMNRARTAGRKLVPYRCNVFRNGAAGELSQNFGARLEGERPAQTIDRGRFGSGFLPCALPKVVRDDVWGAVGSGVRMIEDASPRGPTFGGFGLRSGLLRGRACTDARESV